MRSYLCAAFRAAPLLFATALLAVASPGKPSTRPTVWHVDQTTRIGGLVTTVLGEPTIRDDDSGRALFFNGVSDGLFVPYNPIAGAEAFTIEVLFKPDATGPDEQRFLHVQDSTQNRALIETRMIKGRWALDTYVASTESKQKLALLDRKKTHPSDVWTWVALVYADGRMTHFINAEKELEGAVLFPPMLAGQVSLGVRQNKVYWFKGGIREVRFHRTALTPDELQRVTASAPAASTSAAPAHPAGETITPANH